jgi:hypothetical protein
MRMFYRINAVGSTVFGGQRESAVTAWFGEEIA